MAEKDSHHTDHTSTSMSKTKSTKIDNKNTITPSEWVIGIGLMVTSAVLFSFNGVLIKWGADIGYQSMEIFVFRSGFQLLITVIATFFVQSKTSFIGFTLSFENFNKFKTLEKPLIKWVILRGVTAGIAGICYFHAITIIPLGDAITVFSIYPVVTAFIAWIILRERISIIHGIALAVAIVGIYLIASGTEDKDTSVKIRENTSWFELYFGYIASVIGALSGGFVFVFIRLATKRTSPIILVYSHGFFCLLLSAIVGCFQGYQWIKHKTGETIIIMLCFGVVGYFGQWTMNKSTQLIPAAVSSLVRSSDSVFSYVWQVVIFLTIPSTETIIGAICVIFGIFLVSIEKLRKAYKMKQ
eukprot:193033_1